MVALGAVRLPRAPAHGGADYFLGVRPKHPGSPRPGPFFGKNTF